MPLALPRSRAGACLSLFPAAEEGATDAGAATVASAISTSGIVEAEQRLSPLYHPHQGGYQLENTSHILDGCLSRASNPDKCMPGRRGLNRNLVEIPSIPPACQLSQKLWPASDLPSRKGPSGPDHRRLSPTCRRRTCYSACISTNTCQGRHEVCLEECRIIPLPAKVVRIQTLRELDHLRK